MSLFRRQKPQDEAPAGHRFLPPDARNHDDFDPFAPKPQEKPDDVSSVPRGNTDIQAGNGLGAAPNGGRPGGRYSSLQFGWESEVLSTHHKAMATSPIILTVCTGNVCRSPYMERLLAAELSDVGIRVESAGTRALVGEPIDPGSARLLRAQGIDDSNFAARQLAPEMIRQATLILTATRSHRRDVVQLEPSGLGKTYALGDLVESASRLTDEDIATSDGQNTLQRLLTGLIGHRGEATPSEATDLTVDIVDPYRQNAHVFEHMQAQILPLVKRFSSIVKAVQ